MTDFLIKGGTVVDPSMGTEGRRADVLVEDGKVTGVDASIDRDGVEVIDAAGCVVAPGFVDLHTHVREPGREDEETIATASAAAAAGGFTAICAMPNTDPVADKP